MTYAAKLLEPTKDHFCYIETSINIVYLLEKSLCMDWGAGLLIEIDIGRKARNPVFGVTTQVISKPVCTATETS